MTLINDIICLIIFRISRSRAFWPPAAQIDRLCSSLEANAGKLPQGYEWYEGTDSPKTWNRQLMS
jgi:hypothetical protein